MSRNVGEENEIFLKTFLLMRLNDKKPLGGIFGDNIVEDLKFSPGGLLPEWKDKYRDFLIQRNYKSLKEIFPKAPTGSKADLELNGVRYSVKNSLGAKSAIVNHTNREGFLRVFSLLGLDISRLDKIIDEYWEKRLSGRIMEDIDNQNEDSPFRSHKDYLKPVIEYFLFTGTGSKNSKFPADKMLIFSEPDEVSSYNILSQSEAVDQIWDSLVFSVRSKKGMPTKKVDGVLIDTYDEKVHTDLIPWVRYIPSNPEFPKGALHIRT